MTKIKICGIRRIQDVQAVNNLLPEYAGFVFAPSKRQVSLDEAKELSGRLHPLVAPSASMSMQRRRISWRRYYQG